MINIDDNPKEIVKQLSETEKNILFILGKMRISVNKWKNFMKKSSKYMKIRVHTKVSI